MTITEWILAVLGLIGTASGLIIWKKSIEVTEENEALKKRIRELEFYEYEFGRPHPPGDKIETP